MDYKSIAKQVQDISKETQKHVTEFSWYLTGDTGARSVGWDLLLINRLQQILERLESLSELHERLDFIEEQLSEILGVQADWTKSALQAEVEARLGKPIQELLKERKDKSLREIAQELGVSRGTVSNWLKSSCRRK